jgi:hypothetical protein
VRAGNRPLNHAFFLQGLYRDSTYSNQFLRSRGSPEKADQTYIDMRAQLETREARSTKLPNSLDGANRVAEGQDGFCSPVSSFPFGFRYRK